MRRSRVTSGGTRRRSVRRAWHRPLRRPTAGPRRRRSAASPEALRPNRRGASGRAARNARCRPRAARPMKQPGSPLLHRRPRPPRRWRRRVRARPLAGGPAPADPSQPLRSRGSLAGALTVPQPGSWTTPTREAPLRRRPRVLHRLGPWSRQRSAGARGGANRGWHDAGERICWPCAGSTPGG